MSDDLARYWPLGIPLAIEGVLFIVTVILARTVYPRMKPNLGPMVSSTPADPSSPYMTANGSPQGPYAWLRVYELIIILYRFPVIVPTVMLRKDDTCPVWVYLPLTPLFYMGLMWMIWFW